MQDRRQQVPPEVHLERNVLTKAPQRLRARVANQPRWIFDAPAATEVRRRLHESVRGLGRQVRSLLHTKRDLINPPDTALDTAQGSVSPLHTGTLRGDSAAWNQ